MSAYTVTIRGRQRAEELQVDTCTIKRRTGETTDLDTGVVTPTYTVIYTGQCRLKLTVATARPADVGQAQVFMQHPILSLPATTTGVQVDDLVTITASLLMPSLVNRVFHVRGLAGQTHETAARFEVMEVMG